MEKVALTAEKAGATHANARSRPRARARAKAKQTTDSATIVASQATSLEIVPTRQKAKGKAKQPKVHSMVAEPHGRSLATVSNPFAL